MYGITVEQYEEMLDKQDGKCAICKQFELRPKRMGKVTNGLVATRLSVDHCHDTGRVRGLLCQRCNIAIGHLNHDRVLVMNAYNYLQETS